MTKGIDHKKFKYVEELGYEIPEEWGVDKIDSLKVSMYYGITAKTTREDTKMRFLRVTDIHNFDFNPKELPFCIITEKRSNLSKYYLKKNDIVVARAGTIGISVLVKEDLNDTLYGSYLIKITFNQEKLNPIFIHYYFQSRYYWSNFSRSQGSTIKNITLKFLNSIAVPLPPLDEQRKIAEILSDIDMAIQKTDELIATTQKLKNGLMQTLLTKGIGHTKFKMTEIGEIPEEWKLVTAGQIVEYSKGKNPKNITVYPTNGSAPYLSTDYLRNEGNQQYAKIADKTNFVNNGDIILLWDGSNAGEFFLGKEGILSSTMVKLHIKLEKIDTRFLLYLFKSNEKHLRLQTKGTAIPHVDKNAFENLYLPLPSLSEQQKIAEILSTVDKKLELERQRKEKLERIKKGLMNDLLTGKVRVKVDKK
ncbi:MAG: restriction endonuclease subunit S [Candidatus Micrarchaeaceae archaeon]